MQPVKIIALIVCSLAFGNGLLQAQQKPNIVLILADDMGYSDASRFGSEIETPHIDAIADRGVIFKQFYNAGRCCPTRASLLTGQYAHNTGLGFMTGFDQGTYGYKGEMNQNCVTIAEALKPAGYTSYLSGKWHVSSNIKPKGDKSNWPLQRGFDGYFGILQGSGSYFDPKTLTSGNKLIHADKDFYLTDAISDSATKFIDNQFKTNKPFFLYVAYTAPHWPLHAKAETMNKYLELYEKGWDLLRKQRYKKQIKIGLADKNTKLSPKDTVPAWSGIPEKDKAMWIKRMAIYAAQIEVMDQGVGRIVDALQKNNFLDNTILIFLSDNGACAEYISRTVPTIETIGMAGSFESYLGYWANLSNTPYRYYKTRTFEGGIKAPFIFSWPGKIKNIGRIIDNQPAHVIDLLPTLLSASGASYPSTYHGIPINPLNGQDLNPILTGGRMPERVLYWEHEGNKAILDNYWKLVSKSSNSIPYEGAWELYNMTNDKTELIDLAKKYPTKVKELSSKWENWAKANHVYPILGSDMKTRAQDYPREH